MVTNWAVSEIDSRSAAINGIKQLPVRFIPPRSDS